MDLKTAQEKRFFESVRAYLTPAECQNVYQAYQYAARKHEGDFRQSGEPFITHPLTVAEYIAGFRLDACTLMATLMHDVVEDTGTPLAEIEAHFGRDVSQLVDGVTKLKAKDIQDVNPNFADISREDIQQASMSKLLQVMTQDLRVVIIKMFDRLHNLSTLGPTSPEKQRRVALETLAIYCPIANRLGMRELKNRLEDWCLRFIAPDAYEMIVQNKQEWVLKNANTTNLIINEIMEVLLHQKGLSVQNVTPHLQTNYEIYQMLQERTNPGASIVSDPAPAPAIKPPHCFDITLTRPEECYLAIGPIHSIWRPMPHTFDDYIAAPRDNLYQSLHTTVIYPLKQSKTNLYLKLHIRTNTMKLVADYGILSNWYFAGTDLVSEKIEQQIKLFSDNVQESLTRHSQNFKAGFDEVMEDKMTKQIYVLTPTHEVKALPEGSTPIDFAYTIHTGLGHACRRAHINGRPVPLNTPLKDGQVVHITKKEGRPPQRIWLDPSQKYTKTRVAQNHISRWFHRLPAATAIEEGKELLIEELRMMGMSHIQHETAAGLYSKKALTDFYHALGSTDILPTDVATKLITSIWHQGTFHHVGTQVTTRDGTTFIITNTGGRQARLCRACTPRPGDEIVGYPHKRKDRVTVHRMGCHTFLRTDAEISYYIKLGWGQSEKQKARLISVEIRGVDRYGLLAEITQLIAEEKINVHHINASGRNGKAMLSIQLQAISPEQLVQTIHRIKTLLNVGELTCILNSGLQEKRSDS